MTSQIELVAAGAEGFAATFTDEHSASSYGVPVVVVDGTPYGPGEVIPNARHRRAADAVADALECQYGQDVPTELSDALKRFYAAMPPEQRVSQPSDVSHNPTDLF
jgi:hypothetical protein